MVTIGMNYEVLEGKEATFENAFDNVVHAMRAVAGHEMSLLFRAVNNPRHYLIMSKWSDRSAFEGFIGSEAFRKVADWGKEEVLAGRPSHQYYGDEQTTPAAHPAAAPGKCPMGHG